MVLYKDRGDEYVTKVVQLTENLDRFRADLEKVSAGGGGDEPEDLQAALMDTVNKHEMGNRDGIRLASSSPTRHRTSTATRSTNTTMRCRTPGRTG